MQNRRTFSISEIAFADKSFSMVGVQNTWGADDPILEQIKSGTFDEIETIARWRFAVERATPHSFVLDVGAYAGLFSLVAASARPDIRALAFEPSTMTYGRLVQNILWNRFDWKIIPVNLAASDVEAQITMPHAWGIYTMSPGERLEQLDVDHTQPATAVPIDSILKPCSDRPHFLNSKSMLNDPVLNVAAIKIDVEGHEIAVLRGALETIRKFQPVIFCEFWNQEAIAAIANALEPENYSVFRIANERNLLCLPAASAAQWQSEFDAWAAENTGCLVMTENLVSSILMI